MSPQFTDFLAKGVNLMRIPSLLRIVTIAATTTVLASTLTFSAEPTAPVGWTGGYVLTNGIRIHYWRTGGDKPVLFMAHGYSDDGLCWTDLAKNLEADYDIILADARGHGLSDPPSKSDAADAQVEDLAGLIRELDLEKPIIMGHSMGSSSAAWFAAKYPNVPRAVILEDPRLIPRPPGASRSGSNADQQEERRLQTLARNNESYEDLLAKCMENSPGWSRSECRYWARSKRLYHPDLAYRSTGERPAIDELFTKIMAPTLILKADAKGETRTKNEAVAGLLSNGTLVHVEGAGHCVHRDQMDRSLATLKAFLGKL
jgi:pimeloyl-ACP methyl ester carboxylesterase